MASSTHRRIASFTATLSLLPNFLYEVRMRTSYGNPWKTTFIFGLLTIPALGQNCAWAEDRTRHEATCPMRNDFFTVRSYSSSTKIVGKRSRSAVSTPNLLYINLIARAARVPAEELCTSERQALDSLYSGNEGDQALPKSFL